jgi:biopolymer transport protein ExbD
MGGVSVDGGGGGGRRSLDSEINMIPMIDLLMVTISFLLITAVWSHMARINANAQVPGPPRPDVEPTDVPPEKQLHVQMNDQDSADKKFVLVWKQGSTVVTSIDVPRKDDIRGEGGKKVVQYKELAEKIEAEWKTNGSHRDGADKKFDQAVLHVDNKTPYVFVIGVIDAIYAPQRNFANGGKTEQVPAFNVTFAVN